MDADNASPTAISATVLALLECPVAGRAGHPGGLSTGPCLPVAAGDSSGLLVSAMAPRTAQGSADSAASRPTDH